MNATNVNSEQQKWEDYYSLLGAVDEGEPVKKFNQEFRDCILEILPQPGSQILEAGCGSGTQSLALAQTGKYELSLMDFSQSALSHASELFQKAGMDATFIQEDVLATGQPGYDLVFNAGVLEHYTFEQQVSFLQGMASRSRKYVLVLVPNQLCYWYWIWRVHAESVGHWPFGKEIPRVDLSGIFEAAGLHLLGQTFMGASWTESFIEYLFSKTEPLTQEIIDVHRNIPVIPAAQKNYLIAVLGAVSAEDPLALPGWTRTSQEDTTTQAELSVALVDALALQINQMQHLQQLKAKLSVTEEGLSDALKVLSERGVQLAEEGLKAENFRKQLEEQKAMLQQLSQQHTEVVNLLSRKDAEIANIREQLDEQKAVTQQLSQQHTDVVNLLAKRDTQLDTTSAKVENLTNQLWEQKTNNQSLAAQLTDYEQHNQSLAAQLTDYEQHNQSLTAQLAQREQEKQALALQLAEQEQKKQMLALQLTEREQKDYILALQLAERERQLQTIYDTRSWRLVQGYWRLKERIQYHLGIKQQPPEPPELPVDNTVIDSATMTASAVVAPEPELTPAVPVNRYDVICFPIIDWEFRFQRPQQLLSRFAQQGHRVFYAGTKFATSTEININSKPLPSIYTFTLPSPSQLNLYQDTLDKATLEACLKAFEHFVVQNQVTATTVLVIQLPFWKPLVEALQKRHGWKIVYDCMDEHSGFSTTGDAVVDLEHSIANISDLVVVTARKLYEKLQQFEPVSIPNGTDYNHFHRLPAPGRLDKFQKPIIGYYGAISDWFDVDSITLAATQRPDWSFVLIGHTFGSDVERLSAYPNIYLLGEKPYGELPAYLVDFDVCTIPFLRIPLTEATNPVKFFEYISSGKPVVARDLPELEPYQAIAYLYTTSEEFLEGLDNALAENDPEIIQRRQQVAQANTWQARYEALSQSIKQLYQPVSVIIVSYNSLDYLQQCFDSILEKTFYPNYNVIVIDNASNDSVKAYLRYMAVRYPQIRPTFNTENLGFAAANNIGLHQCPNSEYVVLLNNDVVVTRGWLTKLISYLNQPNIGMVGPVTNSAGNEAKIAVTYNDITEMDSFVEAYVRTHAGQSFDIDVLAMYCVALRREVVDEIGPLDEQFGIGMFEDDDYAMRVRQSGRRIICAEDIFIHHYGSVSFAKLESEAYQKLFEHNKQLYEAKWGTWKPHQYRASVGNNTRTASHKATNVNN